MLGSGKAFVLVPEEIYSLAKAANEPVVEIDLLTGEVRPAVVASRNVLETAEIYSRKLPELLESQSVEPQMVRNALLELRFDFAHPHVSRSSPEVELPNVLCTVSLDDDRGITHQAFPKNWCRD